MPNLGGEHGQTRMNPTLHGAALEHSALVHETAALTEETAELRSLSSACGSALGYHPPPEHYQIGLVIATIGLLVTMGLHRHAVRALRARTAFSSKRVLYRLITGLAPAIAWVHFLAVTSPPMHRVAALAHHCLVAFVMACFMELLLLLLFRTARAGEGGVDESAVPAIPNVLQHFESSFSRMDASHFEPSSYIDAAVGVLRAQPAISFWTSPPLGCLFLLCPALPCAQPQQPTPRLVAVLRRAVLLYSAGALFVPLFEAWAEGTLVPTMARHRDTPV